MISLLRPLALAAAVVLSVPVLATAARAQTVRLSLSVDPITLTSGGLSKPGIGYNGQSPGPQLVFHEGDDVEITVKNNLSESTSIHWHGLLLPQPMDGVPHVSFGGIPPGESYTYRFPIVQAGTYWYHSHSAWQETDGAYGTIVIQPKTPDPIRADQDVVMVLSDAHPDSGAEIVRHLKTSPGYYNRQQRTAAVFLRDVARNGLSPTLRDRLDWGDMRMAPTDIEDVQGIIPLINGASAEENWTLTFRKGERLRLRLVNGSAMTSFDLRIPGLKMLVVQADGNPIQPVLVDELRLAVAETYDVIVQPSDDRAWTVFAESVGRSAFARATLTPSAGMVAEVPAMRPPPLLTMSDMAMPSPASSKGAGPEAGAGGHHHHAAAADSAAPRDPFYAVGSGLTPSPAQDGGKVLSYDDLRALKPLYRQRPPDRSLTLRLTGNMERYIWSFDDVKFQDAQPIRVKKGERVRITFVNETMMAHPMHLHGLWFIPDFGKGAWNPAKHVVSVAPGTALTVDVEAVAAGAWPLHCHLAYHMGTGMFRLFVVEEEAAEGQAAGDVHPH